MSYEGGVLVYFRHLDAEDITRLVGDLTDKKDESVFIPWQRIKSITRAIRK